MGISEMNETINISFFQEIFIKRKRAGDLQDSKSASTNQVNFFLAYKLMISGHASQVALEEQ
eukprot:CAMPEP_0170554594 /NCGR_PEP_ID=MMETSP0211-20121228/12459_1 /TAXON_ID=311385 /ORGANISM="Pseudokeronopsis sp., Strain OXSARD2" /LENGTH=61 /DNA_ID=CAMNT_0010863791 /DNA_START=261 /DNA_END=446 /DNA_ORIENTATION=-